MTKNHSIHFFEQQFQQQAGHGELLLNPFEQIALPYLRGEVLDYGCGLGNLAIAAAQAGYTVLALDGSATAIEHLKMRAAAERLPIRAAQADLRLYDLAEDFDSVVCIGLLMFFDCRTAMQTLTALQQRTRQGGIAVVNVLIEGTTFMDMFEPESHCLFAPQALERAFAGWKILRSEFSSFEAPGATIKAFATVIAQKACA
jgi:tellurite methyltransferase